MTNATGLKSYFIFKNVDWSAMWSATWETIWVTLVSMIAIVIFGIILGLILYETKNSHATIYLSLIHI